MSVKIKLDDKKLKRNIKDKTIDVLNKRTYEITCPHCHSEVKVPTGKSLCPICKKQIDLSLDINF